MEANLSEFDVSFARPTLEAIAVLLPRVETEPVSTA